MKDRDTIGRITVTKFKDYILSDSTPFTPSLPSELRIASDIQRLGYAPFTDAHSHKFKENHRILSANSPSL